ncbi:MAG: phosphatase PAP2 family protein [Rickettsiales bacterium]|nr:phosphatase PAP2 family protein [Rickettsiales bacterium]
MLKEIFYDWGGYNKIISQFIHSAITCKPLIGIVEWITHIGNFYFFPIHFILIVSMFLMMLRLNPKNTTQRSISYSRCLTLLLLNIFIGALVFKTMKNFFYYPRPYCVVDFNIKEYLLYLFKHSQKSCNHSFPSGHTAYICLFIISFWSILNKNLKILGALIMFLVGVSRVILAKHFVADVAYAYLIVLVILNPLNNWLIDKYFPRYQPLVKKLLAKYLTKWLKPQQ